MGIPRRFMANLWDVLDEKSANVMNGLLRNYNLKKFKPDERKNRKTNQKKHTKFGSKRKWATKPWGQKFQEVPKKNV